MRFKIDENLPVELAEALAASGHDAHTVPQEGLGGGSDEVIWQAAQRERRFLITQDLHFADTRRFVQGGHHGVLLVRLKRPGRQVLLDRLVPLLVDSQAWQGCLVIVSDSRTRIIRPLANHA